MTDKEIKKQVNVAIKILFKKDRFLLKNKVNERAVAHKLAEYFQQLFPAWHVDCEYNKKRLESKELGGINECDEQKRTDRVYPDIIIHQRNTDSNLLVIEIKTIRNEEACDIQKLKLFTNQTGDYRYQLGLFIKFNQLLKPEFKYFKNGRQV